MRVDRLSRGTWIIVAVAAGALIAWLHTTLGGTDVTQTSSQTEFINALLSRPEESPVTGEKFPIATSVVISPAIEMTATYAKASTRKAPVSYRLLIRVPGKGFRYLHKTTLVDDPIDHFGEGPQPLTALLAKLATDRPWVRYRYAFWQEPRWTYTLWIGGSVLLIGIIWPTVLRRLVLAGYAGSLEQEEKKEPFWKRLFAGKPKSEEGLGGGAVGSGGAKAAPTTLSDDELARINAMEDGLRSFLATQKEPGGEVEDKAEPEVKKLAAGPLETANEPPKQEEPKTYAGEFYPTATHVKKKDEQ